MRLLACKLVDHWLRIVKGDIGNPSIVTAATTLDSVCDRPADVVDSKIQNAEDQKNAQTLVENNSVSDRDGASDGSNDEKLPVYKITIRNGKKVLAEINADRRSSTEITEEESSTGNEDINQEDYDPAADELDDEDNDLIKPVKLRKKSSVRKQVKQKSTSKVEGGVKKDRDSTDSASSTGKFTNQFKEGSKLSTNKTKCETNKSNQKNKADGNSKKTKEVANAKSNKETLEPPSFKPKTKMTLSLKNKKGVTCTKDNKVLNKCEDKEKNVFDSSLLTEKEKESLSKMITPPISKVGKIPKKTSLTKEEKQSEEKNRTLKNDPPDNKTDTKNCFEPKKSEIKRLDKKISISIEPKKNVPSEARPKTVKTYNSKFRSTGLEEETKPVPTRPLAKKLPPLLPPAPGAQDKKIVNKRSSPPPDVPVPEKKLKPDIILQEEKKMPEKVGGIKLIPPKPKRKSLYNFNLFLSIQIIEEYCKSD